MNTPTILLSCEHASNHIPERFGWLFASHEALLCSHRGMDFGAAKLAGFLSEQLSCVCIQASVSRLLIDCNRSLGHKHCFSEITQNLPEKEKNEIIQTYYLPYRHAVERAVIEALKANKTVYHFSIHSFTPRMYGILRKGDIGLLYDPGRSREKTLAKSLKEHIKNQAPELLVRMNYPYLGTANGLVNTLRRFFPAKDYIGLEIEMNQSITNHSFTEQEQLITLPPTPAFEKIQQILAVSLDLLRG